jgi:hypothetical protein
MGEISNTEKILTVKPEGKRRNHLGHLSIDGKITY